MSGAVEPVGSAKPRIDVVFLLIVLAALLLRVSLATTRGFTHDEENTAIPLAQIISFDPAHLSLPIRAVNHGALPAYFVKIGSELAGTTPLGYRAAHILLGLATILVVYALARRHFGIAAARWASALVAFNEYFLDISARATAHAPYLLFAALALYSFVRFLGTGRARYLYGTAAAVAFGFYCKEHAVLLLAACGLMFLTARYRPWLRRWHPYAAAALFIVLIAPDIAWNLTANPDIDRVTYGNRDASQATYARHLQRIGGLGYSPYPLVFFGRSAIRPVYTAATGKELDDNTAEYNSMNPAIGLLLLSLVVATLCRSSARHDPISRFLLLAFFVVFGLFSLISPGSPDGLDPVSWIWVDATLFPAAVLAGARLAGLRGPWRLAVWGAAAASVAYAAVITYPA